MAGTTVSVSPWGATWPLLSPLCTIGALACVAELLEALTRRVERALVIPVTDAGFAILPLRSRKSLAVTLLLGVNLFGLAVLQSQSKYLPPTKGVIGRGRALSLEKCLGCLQHGKYQVEKKGPPNMKKKVPGDLRGKRTSHPKRKSIQLFWQRFSLLNSRS